MPAEISREDEQQLVFELTCNLLRRFAYRDNGTIKYPG
jgi:hypothetical protein